MAAARCILCDRLLIAPVIPVAPFVTNPEALVVCSLCEALSVPQRQARRSQVMVRMLDDFRAPRRRHHG